MFGSVAICGGGGGFILALFGLARVCQKKT